MDGNKSNKHKKQIPPGSASSGLKILSIRWFENKDKNKTKIKRCIEKKMVFKVN